MGVTRKRLEIELHEYKSKEKDAMQQMEKIQRRFEQMGSSQRKEIDSLRELLKAEKKETQRLENSLFEERRSNKILMSESQSMSRRSMSRLSVATDLNAQEYLQNFLRLEQENRSLKVENKLLAEEVLFVKNRAESEAGLVFASVLGFVVNQRALD